MNQLASYPVPAIRAIPAFTDVFVVSEDEPGVWRVSDRGNERILGPFAQESAAASIAFDGVVNSRRWEIHILDQFGTLVTSYNSEEESLHVSAD